MNKKRRDEKFMICLKPKPSQSFFVYRIQSKDFFFTERQVFKKKWSGGLNKKRKEGYKTALATVIKKDPITSIRKRANKLKVQKKTTRTPLITLNGAF